MKAQLRIGIHLGDITIEDDEIYGDGVNVASRMFTASVSPLSDAHDRLAETDYDETDYYVGGSIELKASRATINVELFNNREEGIWSNSYNDDVGHSDSPPKGIWEEVQAAALRALQLDSLNAEAWAALANSKTYFEWDYEGAEYGYNKANELNPSIAVNHYHYAWHLYLFDRLEEAIEEHELAQKLDPLQAGNTYWLVYLYIEKGEYDKARNEIKRAYRITSDSLVYYSMMGNLYMKNEQFNSAIYCFKKHRAMLGWVKHILEKER